MCKEPMIFTPARGFDGPYLARVAMRPGISCSAISISFLPNSASEMSATKWGGIVSCINFMILGRGIMTMNVCKWEIANQVRSDNSMAPETICVTISGSARVEISPRDSDSPSATFLRILLITFPERVLGSPGTCWKTSTLA